MSITHTTIEGQFPGLNKIIAASKKHWSCYAKMKEEYGNIAQWSTKTFKHFEEPVHIHFVWHYKNAARDPDNMMAGQKFIMDALVHNGVIKDDTCKYIKSITHEFVKDKTDSVEISIKL